MDTDQEYKRRLKQYRKSTKGHLIDETTWTAFRKEEKKYKAKCPPPSLDEVLDLATLLDEMRTERVPVESVKRFKTKSGQPLTFGLNHIPG
jgi:hypothetical protein